MTRPLVHPNHRRRPKRTPRHKHRRRRNNHYLNRLTNPRQPLARHVHPRPALRHVHRPNRDRPSQATPQQFPVTTKHHTPVHPTLIVGRQRVHALTITFRYRVRAHNHEHRSTDAPRSAELKTSRSTNQPAPQVLTDTRRLWGFIGRHFKLRKLGSTRSQHPTNSPARPIHKPGTGQPATNQIPRHLRPAVQPLNHTRPALPHTRQHAANTQLRASHHGVRPPDRRSKVRVRTAQRRRTAPLSERRRKTVRFRVQRLRVERLHSLQLQRLDHTAANPGPETIERMRRRSDRPTRPRVPNNITNIKTGPRVPRRANHKNMTLPRRNLNTGDHQKPVNRVTRRIRKTKPNQPVVTTPPIVIRQTNPPQPHRLRPLHNNLGRIKPVRADPRVHVEIDPDVLHTHEYRRGRRPTHRESNERFAKILI